jgi:hypothetical protein
MANTPSPRTGAGSNLECLFRDYTGPCRDVRSAGSVIPVAVSPVCPPPPLRHHTGHYDDIPGAVVVHGDKTSPRPPLCHLRAPVDNTLEVGPRTAAGRSTTTSPPSKPLLCGHRTRHDATTGTRFARTVVNSTALLTMPPHVGE